MLIDLHVHTSYSEGFDVDLDAVVARAREVGLNGLLLTECDVVPDAAEVRAASERLGFPLFIGVEVNADDGRVIAIVGDPTDARFREQPWLESERLRVADIVAVMKELDGVAIAAHPYLDDGPYLGDRIFRTQGLAAIEVVCGVPGHLPNDLALEAAASLALPTVGGSDSGPDGQRIGSFATAFADTIKTQEQLVSAIRTGAFWAVTMRRPRAEGARRQGGNGGGGGGRSGGSRR